MKNKSSRSQGGFAVLSLPPFRIFACFSRVSLIFPVFQATIQILTSCQDFWFYWLFLLLFCFSLQCKVKILFNTISGEIASCCRPSSLLFSTSHKTSKSLSSRTGISDVFPLHCCASMGVNWLIMFFFAWEAWWDFVIMHRCMHACLIISWLKWFMHIFCSLLLCLASLPVEKCMSSMQMGTQMVKLRGGSKGLVRFFYLDEHKSCIRWRPSRKNEKAKSECLVPTYSHKGTVSQSLP